MRERIGSARTVAAVMVLGVLAGAVPAAALLGAPLNGREWPAYGHDANRTFNGRTTLDSTSVLQLTQAWFFSTGDAVTASPIVVGGTVYVGSWDGKFYAIDATAGTERWHFTIDAQLAIHPQPGNRQPTDATSDGGVITSSAFFLPASGGRPDLVIFGGGYTLYALRAADGSLFWKHAYTGRPELPPDPDNDGSRIFSSPVVVGSQVLFSVTADGQNGYRGYVVAADVATGNPNWILELDVDTSNVIQNDGCGGVWASPTIIERDNVEIISVADCHFTSPAPYNERVLAVNISDGTIKWVFFPPRGDDPMCDFDFGATANLGTAPDLTPTFLGECGKDGYCYSLDPETGAMRWGTNVVFGGFAGGFIATPAYDGTRVYGATALGDFGRFEADPNQVCEPDNPADTPIQEPSMHAFDAVTGAVVWQAEQSQSFAPTTVAGGMTFNGGGITPELQIRDGASGTLLNSLALPTNCDSGISTVGNAIFFGIGSAQQPTPSGVVAYTPLGAAPEIPRTDNYKCYQAKEPGARFAPRPVTLVDDFEAKPANVLRPSTTCNPADVNGEGIADTTAHLACYRIKEAAGFTTRSVLVHNRFGDDTLTVVRAQELCVPSEQNQVPSSLNIDHYKCYKVSHATPRFSRRTVSVADEFGTTHPAVLKPSTLCNAVDKNNEGVKDPSVHLACYKIKDAPRLGAHQIAIHNQFGDENLTALRGRTLCVPSTLP
jgi:polyvinyl alcohol dehydrogenase (cytochrome)